MSKYDLSLKHPIMNAAGSLGFTPDLHGPVDLAHLGAFVTNPVSQGTRSPARGPRFRKYPGGFLLHTGYPNPGLRRVLQRNSGRWARAPLPVLVHLLAQNLDEIAEMVRRLEAVEGVMGIELGLPPDIEKEPAQGFTQAALGELPVIVRLPLESAVGLAGPVFEAGATAVSLGTGRGALPDKGDGLMHGRLYGPAQFPLALKAVEIIASSDVPIIGAGGIYSQQDIQTMLSAGAMAVQLDAVLWRDSTRILG